MRTLRLLFVLLSLLLLSGCWVFSLHPLYEDEDVTAKFDPVLAGAWVDPNGGCLLTFAPANESYPFFYHVEYMAPNEKQTVGCLVDTGKKLEFDGHLVKLGQHRFLDLGPTEKDICFQCLPTHSVYLVSMEKDSLSLVPLDYDWLRAALREKRLTISTTEAVESSDIGDGLTLTLSTKDLRQFVSKYADDQSAFKPGAHFTFQRK